LTGNGWTWLERDRMASMAENGLKWLEIAGYGWNG